MFHLYVLDFVGFEFKDRQFPYHSNSQCHISEANWVYMCGKFIKQDLRGDMTELEVQVSSKTLALRFKSPIQRGLKIIVSKSSMFKAIQNGIT